MSKPIDNDPNRRDLLGIGALVAGGIAFAGSANSAAAQVEDRGTSVRITNVRGLPCGTKAYVKIETSGPHIGWGEITGLEPRIACALVDSLKELVVGENPTRIEFLWQKVFRSHRDMRG